jgi:hypothetical protein
MAVRGGDYGGNESSFEEEESIPLRETSSEDDEDVELGASGRDGDDHRPFLGKESSSSSYPNYNNPRFLRFRQGWLLRLLPKGRCWSFWNCSSLLHTLITAALALTVLVLVFYVPRAGLYQRLPPPGATSESARPGSKSSRIEYQYVPVRADAIDAIYGDASIPLPEAVANDLALDSASCDALFPNLWNSIDAAVEWFKSRGGISLEEYNGVAQGIGHGRSQVAIRNNRLYASSPFF